MGLNIRNFAPEELPFFYSLITKDFLPGEYAPYEVLHKQLREGIQEGLVLCRNEQPVAYSICASGHSNGYVLISLLAVLEEFRGLGVGSGLLERLGHRFSDRQALIVEVERPELSSGGEEESIRRRRIAFYEKAGFYIVPGMDYSIWDIPMHIMALPLKASKTRTNEEIDVALEQIYRQIMQRFMHKFKLRRL